MVATAVRSSNLLTPRIRLVNWLNFFTSRPAVPVHSADRQTFAGLASSKASRLVSRSSDTMFPETVQCASRDNS